MSYLGPYKINEMAKNQKVLVKKIDPKTGKPTGSSFKINLDTYLTNQSKYEKVDTLKRRDMEKASGQIHRKAGAVLDKKKKSLSRKVKHKKPY